MRHRERIGDTILDVTVTAHSAVVNYQAILHACEIAPDDRHVAPWEEMDGWEHELAPVDHADAWNAVGRVRKDNRDYVVKITEDWGNYAYFRSRGASRQVAREKTAEIIRKAKEQIAQWYSTGWEWYGITCELHGVRDSLWGFLGYDDADAYGREQVAATVAGELERAGYTVVGRPIDTRLSGNVHLFDLE